jgi:hypothetical protein
MSRDDQPLGSGDTCGRTVAANARHTITPNARVGVLIMDDSC